MKSMDEFSEVYAEFESAVREQMAKWVGPICAGCHACCCRADVCEETRDSLFLARLLKRQDIDPRSMDDRYGWREEAGCALEYARPPICYEFFCDELLSDLADGESRFAAKTLGKLVDYVGRNALDELHLVEILNESDLAAVALPRLFERLGEARAAFDALLRYAEHGRIREDDRAILRKIG